MDGASDALFRISIPASLGGFEIARLKARRFLLNHAVGEGTIAAVELVLEESVTNTIRYGYERDCGLRWIHLGMTLDDDGVNIELEDDAHEFNPLLPPDPVTPPSLAGTEIGGLGLLMIRRTASALSYSRVNGHNRLSAKVATVVAAR